MFVRFGWKNVGKYFQICDPSNSSTTQNRLFCCVGWVLLVGWLGFYWLVGFVLFCLFILGLFVVLQETKLPKL